MPPLVLAGPIVRRVERRCFWLWIATSIETPLQVHIDIYAPVLNKEKSFAKVDRATLSGQQTVRAGKNIFISLLKVNLVNGDFPVGGYVEYEITGKTNEITIALKERAKVLSLRDGEKLLFFLPFVADEKPLELFHVSCRRIRRSANDAIRAIANECRRRLKDKTVLPSLFILGGDQIYVDDVDDDILDAVVSTRVAMFENKSRPGSRSNFVQIAGLTTEDRKNHLVDFEEICSLYLLSWSSEIVRVKMDRRQTKEVSDWEAVMAHVPTYMIFDDHEVTDDWFIDTKWKSDVLATALGRHFVEDALVAYFLFQGWGNDPTQFADDVERLRGWLVQRSMGVRSPAPVIFDATWSYIVPSDWLIVCLDCRTKRLRSREWSWFEFHESNEKVYRSPVLDPVLVSTSELNNIYEKTTMASVSRNNIAVVVVNTPVFCIPAVGDIHEIWRKRAQLSSRAYAKNLELDPESWDIDAVSWVELTKNLLARINAEKWVILAGDVHYSYIAEGEFGTPSGKSLKCLQVTSSPANNETKYLHHLPYIHHLTSSPSPERQVAQAIWLPQSGIGKGTFPMSSSEEFGKLVKVISNGRGQAPYVKRWLGAVSRGGRTAISTWNAYASIKISRATVDVAISNVTGEREREFSWRN